MDVAALNYRGGFETPRADGPCLETRRGTSQLHANVSSIISISVPPGLITKSPALFSMDVDVHFNPFLSAHFKRC